MTKHSFIRKITAEIACKNCGLKGKFPVVQVDQEIIELCPRCEHSAILIQSTEPYNGEGGLYPCLIL